MSFLLPRKPPKPQTVVTPSRSDAEVQSLAEEQRKRYYSGQGGRGTAMLTGGLGANPGYGSAATLLGGGM